MREEVRKQHVTALLQEREGYKRHFDAAFAAGDDDEMQKWQQRLDAVDGALTSYGHSFAPQHRTAEKRRSTSRSSRRASSPAESSDEETSE